MNGIEQEAGAFVYDFRQRLFQEHFGLTEDEIEDPLSLSFKKNIQNNAKVIKKYKISTDIYHKIFEVYPHDSYTKIVIN